MAFLTALHHRSGETHAVLQGAAVDVGPVVGERRQELAEQVAVPGMDLDSVEAGLPGQQRRAGELS